MIVRRGVYGTNCSDWGEEGKTIEQFVTEHYVDNNILRNREEEQK
jgi:hypothetical protein